MIIELKRWIEHLNDEDSVFNPSFIPQGEFTDFKIRLDRIDGYSIEDDELVLIIGGNEFFFEYDDKAYKQIDNYFKMLNTSISN